MASRMRGILRKLHGSFKIGIWEHDVPLRTRI